MASEFLYVAGAGLAILIVGGVLAGFVAEAPDSTGEVSGDFIFSEELGTIGTINATSRTPIDGWDATVTRGEPNRTAVERGRIHVGASILGASADIMEFEATAPRRVYIRFVAAEASSPEDLEITVNGEQVDIPDFEPGDEVTLSSDAVEEGTNVIRVTARNPGLAFWKMPGYTLRNVDVIVDDRANEAALRPFRAFDYEVAGFDRGELRFSITEDVNATEPLVASINGNEVMRRTAITRALPYTATFSANGTGLTPGENVLSLRTSGDADYRLENVRVTLYYFATDRQRTVTRTVPLSSSDHGRIGEDGGRIIVDVDRVMLRRPATIRFGDATFERELNGGENTFTFGQDDVESGDNELSISTSGSYQIRNFTITTAE